MGEKTGMKKKPETRHENEDIHQIEGPPPRAPSVPEGQRPVLIVEPGGNLKLGASFVSKPEGKRKDPFPEPEMLAARVKTQTIKSLGQKFSTLSRVMELYIGEAFERAREIGSSRVLEILEWISCVNQDMLYISKKAELGMAEIQLPSLVRDAVKRAHPGTSGTRFRLPDLSEDFKIVAHPQHLLEALSITVSILISRIGGRGEISVYLSRAGDFTEIKVKANPDSKLDEGDQINLMDHPRLRHLVIGLHNGTISLEAGKDGETSIVIGLPM